ncbi:MAG: SDR family NAD(P)-dependent oxidoreductase [Armatimonadota bacterium]|nr:SDR family NAD(P)-dependent oxidoreductase [Armatimonadota bacterium]MDR7523665.1 SDR family NAD(P)-dependent oxidoreductase [Armatimonadota bacterium]
MLAGLSALVTGAGSGMGRAIAHRLAREGARVWVTDVDEGAARAVVGEIVAAGNEATGRRLDVTSRANLEAVAAELYANGGRLDLLIVNAGVSTMNRFLDLSDEEWEFNFAVNARGAFLTMQTFARRMVQQEPMPGRELRGKIVAIASMAARRAAPLLAHYSASKFALLGLAQAAAKELAPHRLTVNVVNPGYVRTPMQDREVLWESALRGITAEDVIREYVRDTPLGHLQTPEDVAGVVTFLCSPDADFLTGEAIEANGGAWMS